MPDLIGLSQCSREESFGLFVICCKPKKPSRSGQKSGRKCSRKRLAGFAGERRREGPTSRPSRVIALNIGVAADTCGSHISSMAVQRFKIVIGCDEPLV